jgi:hypothetical protein
VVRIAISQAAFEAIAATLPLGSVSFENAVELQADLAGASDARQAEVLSPGWLV